MPSECNVLGMEELMAPQNGVTIYPNAAKNEFFIIFPENLLGKVNVETYDLSGKLLYSEDKILPDQKKVIHTSGWENGTYIIIIKGLGLERLMKVIVNR
ncbi:T9SS type A sorting domain-containing protein [Chryseobacterium sp. 1B4]